MPTPFVMITTHRIKPDRLDEFTERAREYNAFVEDNEPRMQAHVVYFDAHRTEVSLVQVHPDAESADHHMRLAHEVVGRGIDLVDTVAVEVFGEPGPVLGQALEANAAAGASVTVKPAGLAGFLRPTPTEPLPCPRP